MSEFYGFVKGNGHFQIDRLPSMKIYILKQAVVKVTSYKRRRDVFLAKFVI